MPGKDEVKGFQNKVGFGSSDRPDQRPLPLRVICVADFCGASEEAPSAVVPIDAHDFDKVMSRVAPRAYFEVDGHLGAKQLEVDFVLRGIKDLDPARIAAQVPPLAAVQRFVERAGALEGGSLAPNDFKRDLADFTAVTALRPILDDLLERIGGSTRTPVVPRTDDGGALDSAVASIFSMVDTGKRDSGGSAIDAAAAAVSSGARFDLSSPIKQARALLQKQTEAILHHPQFRALEGHWRGLHVLCRQGKAARIELLHAAAGDSTARLGKAVLEADRAGTADPVSLILCDEEIANTAEGNDRMQALGEIGAELQAPVVVKLDEAFLGVESMAALGALDAPATLFDGDKFDKWRSLRGKDAARWLVAAVNGFALRPPCTRAKHGFDETIRGAADVAWGSPVYLVGAAVTRSFENTGWPSRHTGIADGEIPGLHVFEIFGRDGQYPLQTVFSDRHLKDLSRAGLTPVMCQANDDSAWLLQAPLVRKPSRAEEEGKLNTLAYAMLASRIGASIMRAKGRLVSGNDVDRTQVNFEQFLDGLLSDTGLGAGASVEIAPDAIKLKLRVGRTVLNGVEIEMSLPT